MTRITPTIGRIVWYIPHENDLDEGMVQHSEQPFRADVVYVWSDVCVNLMVLDHEGYPFSIEKVILVQEGNPTPEDEGYAIWMPYQKAVAAGTQKPNLHA